MSDTEEPGQPCLNCGEVLSSRYCAQCGQDSRERRAPFLRMLAVLFDAFLSLDSVVLRSVPKLLVKPGALTREYLEGHRASQVAPLRLYLFISILFFLFFSIPEPDPQQAAVIIDDQVVGESDDEGAAVAQEGGEGAGSKGGRRSAPVRISFGGADEGEGFFAERLARQKARMESMEPHEILERLVRGVNAAIPKVLILFVPLIALVLRFVFLFTRWIYFDHLIFALHSQSAYLLALLLTVPFKQTAAFGWLVALALILMPVHCWFAMREAYPGGRLMLSLRYALFNVGYFFLFTILAAVVGFYATLTV